MKRTILPAILLTAFVIQWSAAAGSVVSAASAGNTVDRPSVMQAQDLAHRNATIDLAPAAPAATVRSAAAAPRASTHSGGLQREVLGFATYWELASGNLSDVQWDKVGTVSYFGLTLNASGGFDNDGGMTGWNSSALTSMIGSARAQGDRVVVTIKSFSDASINPVVSNSAVGQTAIGNIIAAVRSKGLDGVNIDFEGSTSSGYPNIQTDFTNWVKALSQQLRSSIPGAYLTLDAYSGSASWDGGFMRIDTLAPYVDAFFIMAYDMTAPSDLPNAPLAGPYTYTDTTSVDQYLAKVGGDGSKVILGVPYYGYKFSTSSNAFNAPVTGGQATPAYSDILADIQCASGSPDNLVRNWDSASSTPWLAWYSPASGDPCAGNRGSWRETYYDDAASLGAKYDLVNQRNIRGVGMWALGYDHGSTDLWQAIGQRFTGVRWAGWASLGGAASGRVTVAANADGRLEAFARDSNGVISHTWQTAPSGGWSPWSPLGGGLIGDPQVATNSDGRLEVFAVGTDNQLWHVWQAHPGAGWSSSWYALGGSLAGRPAVRANRDGRLEAFARGTDGAVWHSWQQAPSSGWAGVYSLGGTAAADPAVAINGDGRLEVFSEGSDTAIWHAWQARPGAGWTQWYSLGGTFAGPPEVGRNQDGRLEVFARGTNKRIWHAPQQAPGAGWYAFGSMAGADVTADPTVARNADGRLELFSANVAGGVVHAWQMAPNSDWVPWADLGTLVAAAPVGAGSNADGRLELVTRTADGAVWHNWQLVPNGGW